MTFSTKDQRILDSSSSPFKCPECGGSITETEADRVCQECGLVIGKIFVDGYFVIEERADQRKASRYVSITKPLIGGNGSSSFRDIKGSRLSPEKQLFFKRLKRLDRGKKAKIERDPSVSLEEHSHALVSKMITKLLESSLIKDDLSNKEISLVEYEEKLRERVRELSLPLHLNCRKDEVLAATIIISADRLIVPTFFPKKGPDGYRRKILQVSLIAKVFSLSTTSLRGAFSRDYRHQVNRILMKELPINVYQDDVPCGMEGCSCLEESDSSPGLRWIIECYENGKLTRRCYNSWLHKDLLNSEQYRKIIGFPLSESLETTANQIMGYIKPVLTVLLKDSRVQQRLEQLEMDPNTYRDRITFFSQEICNRLPVCLNRRNPLIFTSTVLVNADQLFARSFSRSKILSKKLIADIVGLNVDSINARGSAHKRVIKPIVLKMKKEETTIPLIDVTIKETTSDLFVYATYQDGSEEVVLMINREINEETIGNFFQKLSKICFCEYNVLGNFHLKYIDGVTYVFQRFYRGELVKHFLLGKRDSIRAFLKSDFSFTNSEILLS